MEESQRAKLLEGFKILNAQFDESVRRARADLQGGQPLEDLIAGGVAEFSKSEVGHLAAVVICRLLKEAGKPVPKPRKKPAVIANRRTSKPLTREVPDVG
jgi:hypothetical protein